MEKTPDPDEFTVEVKGYGFFVLKFPELLTEDKVKDAIADAVRQTMQLVDPQTQSNRFHPALGFGEHNKKE
jgi:hypothetical protein